MQFKPGDIFLSKYEISGLIGTGAFGSVYKARDMKLDRTVAIKIMRSAQGTLQNFESEIDAVKRLEHPNVARLYDFDVIKGGIPCLVMEFVDGRELGYILSTEGNFDFDRLGNVGLQVLDALVETHKLGIVHCDLKPENIMLTRSGARSDVVKLIDFGVASLLTHMHSDNAKDRPLVGTPQYMAPEQIRRDNIGPWTDIYAVGLILIELWTGRIVFDHEDPREVLRQQLYSDVPIPAEIASTEIGPIIRRAVEKNVADRYQDTLVFYEDLKNAIDVMKTERQMRKMRAESSDYVRRERAFPSIFEDTSGGSIFDTLSKLNAQDNFDSLNVKFDGRADFYQNGTGQVSHKDSPHTITLSELERKSSLRNATIPPLKADEGERELSQKRNGIETDMPFLAKTKQDAGSGNQEQKNKPNVADDSQGEELSFGSITNSIDRLGSGFSGDSPMMRQKLEQDAAEARNERSREDYHSGDHHIVRTGMGEHRSHKSLPRQPAIQPKKNSRSRVIVFCVVISIFSLCCLAAVMFFLYSDLEENSHWFDSHKTENKGALAAAGSKEEAIPGVRRAAVVDLAKKMASSALTGAVESTLINPKRLRRYDIIGTPLDAGIYIDGMLTCKTTPCTIHVYSDPSKIQIEIRTQSNGKGTGKSKSMLLSEHKDLKKPLLLSVQ